MVTISFFLPTQPIPCHSSKIFLLLFSSPRLTPELLTCLAGIPPTQFVQCVWAETIYPDYLFALCLLAWEAWDGGVGIWVELNYRNSFPGIVFCSEPAVVYYRGFFPLVSPLPAPLSPPRVPPGGFQSRGRARSVRSAPHLPCYLGFGEWTWRCFPRTEAAQEPLGASGARGQQSRPPGAEQL